VARAWKEKFSEQYGHKIFEEDLVERERESSEARSKPHNKPLQ
jgi:hypothetical protein